MTLSGVVVLYKATDRVGGSLLYAISDNGMFSILAIPFSCNGKSMVIISINRNNIWLLFDKNAIIQVLDIHWHRQ